MIAQPGALSATLEAMRERAQRLEREAAALRSDLDEMVVWAAWETNHAIAPNVLQEILVPESDIADYRQLVGTQYPDSILQLVLQAQKVATRLKQSVRPAEREAAIGAVIQALNQAAAASGLSIPTELEVVIGD